MSHPRTPGAPASEPPPATAGPVGVALSAVRTAYRAMHRAWRRSLQLRVVTITLLVSGLLVGTFGYLVVELTTDSALDRAYSDASRQVVEGAEYARGQLSIYVQPDDTDLRRRTMPETVERLSEAGRMVALVPPPNVRVEAVTSGQVPIIDLISDELAAAVGSGQVARQIVTGPTPEGEPVPYLVYGAPVAPGWGEGPPFQLYYLIPLTAEAQVAADVRNTVLATGVALVLLLVVVTWLVTRMVVHPVRMAARTAQRLSAGLLDQRMVVDGEDDLALLADSFNQMAANLQQQIVRLEEMSRLQRRFTSDVSHELRTPLTTVRMAADVLFAARDRFPPEVARSAELLQHELDRFESLLTELLEISRFDAGFATLDSEPTDLVVVVRRVVDQLQRLAERAGVEIRTHVPDEPVIAEVDPRRVERILRNLVGNAVEYGERRPVDVVLAGDDHAVAVTVRDRGVGLRPGEEKLVFNRFWRADQSRARQTGGTGLGLSISMEDAKLHGGWLEAVGQPGRGSVFRLTLPLRAGDPLRSSPLPLRLDEAAEPGGAEPERTGGPSVPAQPGPAAPDRTTGKVGAP